MKFFLYIFIILFAISALVYGEESADSTQVKDSNMTVLGQSSDSIETVEYIRPFLSDRQYKGQGDKFGIWLDSDIWLKVETEVDDGSEYEFEHIDGNIYAKVYYDKKQVTIDELYQMVIDNSKITSPDMRVTFEENRIVNGRDMLCVRIDRTSDNIPMTYFGYYYSGWIGTIQMVTIIRKSHFEEYYDDLEDILNGLEVYK